MTIERLQYGQAGAIERYATFDRRCRDFVNKYAPPAVNVPTDAILREMFQRWLGQPDCAGYFVACGPNGIVGHIVSWIINYYGEPKVFVWQIEIDENFEKTVVQGVDALRSWISSLNVQLLPTNRIETVELVTWHEPKLFVRYLRKANIEPLFCHSTMQFRI